MMNGQRPYFDAPLSDPAPSQAQAPAALPSGPRQGDLLENAAPLNLEGLRSASSRDQCRAIALLKSLQASLPQGKQEFVTSLLRQHAEREGWLSEKQWDWVGNLIKAAQAATAPRETHTIGAMSEITKLFETAKKRLRFPAVVLAYEDEELRLSVATENAAVPGSINVVVDAPSGGRIWLGRILQDGVFEKSRRDEAVIKPELLALLSRFAVDPRATAAEYGRLTNTCCFCHLPLTDPVSAEAGVGPTCAKNWGMSDLYKAAKIKVKANGGCVTELANPAPPA